MYIINNMNLQEQLNRIQEIMNNSSKHKQMFGEEVERTQFYNYLSNRFEIVEINGRDKLRDKEWNETYFTHNNQIGKTIDNVIYRTRFDATTEGKKELIKLYKSFCKKMDWDCDRNKETIFESMLRRVVDYFITKVRTEI